MRTEFTSSPAADSVAGAVLRPAAPQARAAVETPRTASRRLLARRAARLARRAVR